MDTETSVATASAITVLLCVTQTRRAAENSLQSSNIMSGSLPASAIRREDGRCEDVRPPCATLCADIRNVLNINKQTFLTMWDVLTNIMPHVRIPRYDECVRSTWYSSTSIQTVQYYHRAATGRSHPNKFVLHRCPGVFCRPESICHGRRLSGVSYQRYL